MRGRRVARAEEAPSRARRFALALAARPLTARTPAPGYGHTHEAHATRMRVQASETQSELQVFAGRWPRGFYLSDFDGLDEFVGSPALKLEIDAKAQMLAGNQPTKVS